MADIDLDKIHARIMASSRRYLDNASEEELVHQLRTVRERKQQEVGEMVRKLEALGYKVTK